MITERFRLTELDHIGRIVNTTSVCLRGRLFESVAAGFPSPADDHHERAIDIGRYLVKNPAATFYVKVKGDSMLGAGIHPGDILVVDRSLVATHGSIVVAVLNGEFTVKRLHRQGGVVRLVAENTLYPDLAIEEWDDFSVWGVVAHVLHKTL